MARCRQAPYKMASEMGLEPLQISTCYKMAGLLKVISYKMTLEIGRLKKGHFIGVKKNGDQKIVLLVK